MIAHSTEHKTNMYATTDGKARILLAEDDPINQQVTRSILEKSGYLVDVANNGREALDLLKEHDYALVLMDCMMPVLDGYDATIAIRNQASAVKNHDIPVIALTANAFKEDRDRCCVAGMNDFIAKPFEVEDVLAALGKWAPIGVMDVLHHATVTGGECAISEMAGDSTTMIFDRDDYVRRNMGNLDLSRKVAALFMATVPEYAGSIRSALADRDVTALCQSAHKLKGASANLSLPHLSDSARMIESFAAAGELEKATDMLTVLEQRLEQAIEMLESELMNPQERECP